MILFLEIKDKSIKTWSDLEKAANDNGDKLVSSNKNAGYDAIILHYRIDKDK